MLSHFHSSSSVRTFLSEHTFIIRLSGTMLGEKSSPTKPDIHPCSTNMLQRVRQRSQGHTNTSTVASSTILSFGKLYYYLIFARLYAFCLRQANYLMVNSSWTKAHIDGLLSGRYTDLPDYNDSTVTPSTGSSMSARIVYPPCDSKTLSTLKLENRENVLLSVAQFRCAVTRTY